MRRYKKAEAVATGYCVICPYKACGIAINTNVYTSISDNLVKGEIITCPNCRKGIRISKVV